jgi:hypothetical protein
MQLIVNDTFSYLKQTHRSSTVMPIWCKLLSSAFFASLYRKGLSPIFDLKNMSTILLYPFVFAIQKAVVLSGPGSSLMSLSKANICLISFSLPICNMQSIMQRHGLSRNHKQFEVCTSRDSKKYKYTPFPPPMSSPVILSFSMA